MIYNKRKLSFGHLLHLSYYITILTFVFASFCEGVDLTSQLLPDFFEVKKRLPQHIQTTYTQVHIRTGTKVSAGDTVDGGRWGILCSVLWHAVNFKAFAVKLYRLWLKLVRLVIWMHWSLFKQYRVGRIGKGRKMDHELLVVVVTRKVPLGGPDSTLHKVEISTYLQEKRHPKFPPTTENDGALLFCAI